MNTLKAEKRGMDTKAKRLRREGYVTGNVFGKRIEGSIPVKIEKTALDRLLKTSGKGSRIQLDVDGEAMDVLIKEIDIDHLKNEVAEIDFQALVSGEMIHSVAEIILLNHDKVAEGIVEQHLSEISYRALPSALVERVEVDVAEMKAGDADKVKDLPIASDRNVHLMTDPEAVVVSVGLAHNAPAEEPSAEEETATAEA